jgi:EAL domain-containing protein (putative c-di-GMP-specific phosphodiesterase class I)
VRHPPNEPDGIERGKLVLEYQPKVDLRTKRLRGVEAVVRWHRPGAGLLPPDQFAPLAEQTGLIRSLSTWVLNAALAQCRAWLEEGMEISVAVNLSMRNLQDPYGQPGAAMQVATLLSQGAVDLHLDDFGTCAGP